MQFAVDDLLISKWMYTYPSYPLTKLFVEGNKKKNKRREKLEFYSISDKTLFKKLKHGGGIASYWNIKTIIETLSKEEIIQNIPHIL